MTVSELIAELHRRRVFRVMAVYAVIAFLVLALIELAMVSEGVPPSVLRWAIWIVIVGTPVVAILTWFFDITPWGVLKTPATGALPRKPTGLIDRRIEFVIIIVLLVALGLAMRGMIEDLRLSEQAVTDTVTPAKLRWDAFAEDVQSELFDIWPHFAVAAGDHEYDGELPDYSLDGLARQIGVLRGLHVRAESFEGQEVLDEDRAFERDLVLWYTDRSLFWLETARWPQRNPAHYRSMLSPRVYVDRPYAAHDVRLAAFTRFLEGVPELLGQIRDRLKLPLPETYHDLAVGFFSGMARYLEDDAPLVFASVLTGEAERRFVAANAAAVAAYRETVAWLESGDVGAADGYAMGESLYLAMLERSELLETSLADFSALADEDLRQNLWALREACAAFDATLSVRDCVAAVEADKPEEGAVERATQQLESLRQFVRDGGLISVPSSAVARVAEAPPYRRANMAYIDIPGPLEPDGLPSTYYVAPPDPSWEPAVRQAFVPGAARLMFISAHEVWPGHFVHGLHRARVARPLVKLLRSSVFSEGWAHYAEQMMWDAGFGADDVSLRIGQLLGALKRNVRFVSSIGLHTRGMSVAESEQLFVEQAFADVGNARQQAARGTYDPGYFSYTLGKLLIGALREEWLAQRGTPDDWRAFHDELMKYGSAPLPLVRRYMLEDQPPR